MRRWLETSMMVASLLIVTGGCISRGDEPQKPLIGGMGKLLLAGKGQDLRLSTDGKWAAFLKSPSRPAVKGLSPTMALGELWVVPLSGGAPRNLGASVTNSPGGFFFTADSRWLLGLRAYNPVQGAGELAVMDLNSPGSEPVTLGKAVSLMTVSPDSKSLAFLDGGVLKLQRLGEAVARSVGAEVRVAQFSPDSAGLVYRRSYSAGGALMHLSLKAATAEPVKLGDRCGDFDFSPDGKWIAFTVESGASRDLFDLSLARTDTLKPKKVSSGTEVFGFSPDSKWLARNEGNRLNESHKLTPVRDLVVSAVGFGPSKKVGEKVERFSFSPTSNAIIAFEKPTDHLKLGRLKLTPLPKGDTELITQMADTFEWSPDGKFVAFNVEVYHPLPSVHLYTYKIGEPQAKKVEEGVYGYSFAPKQDLLFYRSQCTKGEGGRVLPRSCELRRLDLASTPAEPAKTVVSAVDNYRLSSDGKRLLLTMVRSDSDAYDTAEYSFDTAKRKTLDERTVLPPLFASPDGKRVVYLISNQKSPGLYLSESTL